MRSILKEISIQSLTGTVEDDGIAIRVRVMVGTRPLEPFVRTAFSVTVLWWWWWDKGWGGLGRKSQKRERQELGVEMLQAMFAVTWRPSEVYRGILTPSLFYLHLERADTPRVKVFPSFKLEYR